MARTDVSFPLPESHADRLEELREEMNEDVEEQIAHRIAEIIDATYREQFL